MAAQADPELRKQAFILKPGLNEISIKYLKWANTDPLDRLEVSLGVDGYPAPVLFLLGQTALYGAISEKIDIAVKAPESFRPLTVADGKKNRLALLTVHSSGVTSKPVLNGTPGTTMMGMTGTVALGGVVTGENQLRIDFEGTPQQELKFSITTPGALRSFTRQLDGQGRHTKSMTFAGP